MTIHVLTNMDRNIRRVARYANKFLPSTPHFGEKPIAGSILRVEPKCFGVTLGDLGVLSFGAIVSR